MAKQSVVQLGRTVADDERLSQLVGGKAERFLLMAQRIIWGATQADLVQVDVPAVARKLVKEYPNTPASYAVAAYGMRTLDRAEADRLIARAWEHPDADHPHRNLLPEKAEWEGAQPEQELSEVVPGRIWQVVSYASPIGGDLARSNVATIVRTEDAGLVIVNPVAFSEAVAEEIRGLGEVSALAVQGAAHSRGLAPAFELFPKATRYATASHRTHPPSATMAFDAVLGERSPSEELTTVYVGGGVIDEQVLWHAPTRSLITQDIVMGNFRNRGLPFSSLIYYFGFGVDDRIGLAGYQIFLIQDLARFRDSFKELASLEPERILDAHFRVAEGDALKGLSEVANWLEDIGPGGHKRMLLRYFLKQPGFLRDLIRYKRNQRKLS